MRATNNQSRRVQAHERHLQALELRKAGATYQAIAEQLGYAHAKSAYKAVASALRATLREPAAGVRELEVARLDSALLAVWRRVQAGDDKAIDRLLRISERRAKLLGLDAAIRKELSGPGGGPLTIDDASTSELARRFEELVERTAQRMEAYGDVDDLAADGAYSAGPPLDQSSPETGGEQKKIGARPFPR